MLAARFEKEFDGWEDKLEKDEWYFCSLRDSLVNDLSSREAFEEINEVVELIIKTNDEFLCGECFELLLALVRRSNTTEFPMLLDKHWELLRAHMNNFGEYQLRRFGELSDWYRRGVP